MKVSELPAFSGCAGGIATEREYAERAPRNGGAELPEAEGKNTRAVARLAGRPLEEFAETRNALAGMTVAESGAVVCDASDGGDFGRGKEKGKWRRKEERGTACGSACAGWRRGWWR